jgi:hypothetical protein
MNKTVSRLTKFSAALCVAAAVSGCEAEKSRNPLSPNVAGPIAGVSISPPTPATPINGAEVTNSTPVRLTFNNASSTGERPFWYVVELASDAGFANKVYANAKVTAAAGTQTSVVVDAALTADRTYFWRVKADDGANASEFSAAARFDLVVPIVIEAPVPISPVSGLTATSTAPIFVVNNGGVQGRAGKVEYWFEVSTDQAFTKTFLQLGTERTSGAQTTIQMPQLPPSSLLYWRVAGYNGKITGPWSLTQSFRTPAAAPAPSPSPSPSPVPPPSPGGRTPDPPPGGRLPLPNMFGVVQQVAAQYPAALQNSCQDHGGTWEFMDRVMNELRRYDTRWGYNGKRGNSNDPSKDAIAYHWSGGPDEGSTEVYIIDIIGSHCGSPSPAWVDVTDITYSSGTIGRWTGRGRF